MVPPGSSIRKIPGSQLRSEPPAAGVGFKGPEIRRRLKLLSCGSRGLGLHELKRWVLHGFKAFAAYTAYIPAS